MLLSNLIKRISRYFTHPLVLAIPLTVIILALIPPLFQKYKGSIEKVETVTLNTSSKVEYTDLNKDGYSEKVQVYNYQYNSASIRLFDYKGALIDVFNFGGLHNSRFEVFTGDFNNNNINEIYFFTQHSDSLIYINHLEFIRNNVPIRRSRLITKVKLQENKLDLTCSKIGVWDLNNDGSKEVVCYLFGGYSLQPRYIYAWDIKNDTLLRSPKSYAKVEAFKTIDIDNDGIPEIIANSSASGNVKDTTKMLYHDHSAWLMVFDNHLKFKYPPKEYKEYGTCIRIEPFKRRGRTVFFVLEYNHLSEKEYAKIYLMNQQFKVLKEKKIEAGLIYLRKIKKQGIENFLVYYPRNGIIELYDSNLKKISKHYTGNGIYTKDIDLDKEDEIIHWNNTNSELSISRSNFSHPVKYSIPESAGDNYGNQSIRLNGDSAPQFSYQRGNKIYLLNYAKNHYYFLKFPFYLTIYTVFVLFFYLLQKTQKKRIEEKYATEREITQLQIRTIKNQADPHFIFNALNSISSIIYKEDKDTAYEVLNDFSALIRSAIVNSDKISISLAEELDFIENYLKLEKIRFKDKFSYEIEVGNEVNQQIKVPRMVIQTYVENAIKHGIMHADYHCLLQVIIKESHDKLIIEIDENGIGREKAKKYSSHSTGKGLQIIEQIFQLYNKLNGVKINHSIEDKKDENNIPLGTKVIVEIPI